MIVRDPSAASSQRYDLIVIGGGIYGVCLAMEATRRGLKPLLIERDDFGCATSWNSLRIIHGGLRYLQTCDLRRVRESVQERRWFLREFPDLVQPLPCLMPLYSNGSRLKRPSILRLALAANDMLSCRRNTGVRRDRRLASGRILSALDTRLLFPQVRSDELLGGALWHDAAMISPQRILMEILLSACAGGATALSRMRAVSLLAHRGRTEGVVAVDELTHEMMEFRASVVINAAGPWCRELAYSLDGHCESEVSRLFRPSLAYNLLLDCSALSTAAVAVSSPPQSNGAEGESRVYFLYMTSGGLLAGTEHVPILNGSQAVHPCPTSEDIGYTLRKLNEAVPGLNLTLDHVLRVYCGFLPARIEGTEQLTVREMICDHGKRGGPGGLFSISGVKFTTARLVAERVIGRLPVRSRTPSTFKRIHTSCEIDLVNPNDFLRAPEAKARAAIRRLTKHECALTADDLILRRTGWADDPRAESNVRARLAMLLQTESDRSHSITASERKSAVKRTSHLTNDSASWTRLAPSTAQGRHLT